MSIVSVNYIIWMSQTARNDDTFVRRINLSYNCLLELFLIRYDKSKNHLKNNSFLNLYL